jgi:hypothetical protein
MIEIENLFSFSELSLNFIENFILKNQTPLKRCLMKNLKENLNLLAKENLNSILNLKLKIEYKKSKNEDTVLEFEKFFDLNIKLIKRVKRLKVQLINEIKDGKETIIFKGLLKLMKNMLFKFQLYSKTKFIDYLDCLIRYLNDYVVLIEFINFDEKINENTNNNALDLFENSKEFNHSTPKKNRKKIKDNCISRNRLKNSVFIVLLLIGVIYLFLKYFNSKSNEEEDESLKYKNLVGKVNLLAFLIK